MRNELTWEYLFIQLDGADKRFQELIKVADADMIPGLQEFQKANFGLHAVLPRLHAHSELNKYIPYLGLSSFMWWPAESYWLSLSTWKDRNSYDIVLTHKGAIIAESTVGIDEVIDTLLDYIHRAQHDNATTNN